MFNPYLVVPIVAWAISQTAKFLLAAAGGRVDFRYLYASGGMPSVHAAVVSALAATAFLVDGPESPFFGITLVVAAIVMYDSFGVRRASGEQAVAINELFAVVAERSRIEHPRARLREVLGHEPKEVAAGAALGVVIAILFQLEKFTPQLEWLASLPVRIEMTVYAAIFGLLLVGGVIFRLWIGKRYKDSAILNRFAKQIFIKTEVIGWIGAILVLAQFQKLPVLGWRVWAIIILLLLAVWDLWLFMRYRHELPEALALEKEASRKKKWLPQAKKKRKKARK